MNKIDIHQRMWLAPDVLQWRVWAQDSHMQDDKPWRRPYDIWKHAERLLEKPATDFVRVDAIRNLKQAIEQREKLIKDIYKLQNIPIKNKSAKTFELLEYIGVIKPFMHKKLFDIRNAVEHEDAEPPPHDDCRVFLEFVWYFLRSTDSLVRLSVGTFSLYPGDQDPIGPYGLESEMGPKNGWIPEVRGTVRPNLISENPMDSWIELNIRNIETHSAYLSRQFSLGLPPPDHLEGANPEDVHFSGEIKGPTEYLRSFVQIYFKAL